jgi:hypothetical protein
VPSGAEENRARGHPLSHPPSRCRRLDDAGSPSTIETGGTTQGLLPMSTTLLDHLTPADLDDIGRELDAIRD